MQQQTLEGVRIAKGQCSAVQVPGRGGRCAHCGATTGEDGGFVRVLASKADHRLLGVQAVGQHVAEMSNSFAQMLEMGAVLEDVAGVIHVHPTLGEAFHEASLRARGHAIHI